MIKRCVLAGLCAGGIVPRAMAVGPSVEVRFVERTGQTDVTSADKVLDFAVQVRVNGSCLGGVAFDAIRIMGEAEGNGTLQRAFISNADGTYSNAITTSGVGGRTGLAAAYSYYSNLNASFNGTINVSAGTFTNGPDQEIGLVLGSARSGPLLAVPGMDVDQDGNPDMWSGNGGPAPQTQVFAPLDPALATPYFAKDAFLDIYRFRYTVSNLTARTLHFVFLNPVFYTFDNLVGNNGDWAANIQTVVGTNLSVGTFDVPVTPGPGAGIVGAVGLGAALCARRRRG